jgi:hypothetical protein
MRTFLALAALFSVVSAQDRASLTGTVLDASGAGVAGAELTVSSVATGAERRAATDGNGIYRVGGLILGTYKVSVERAGFAKLEIADVRLRAGETRTLDPVLQVAAQASAVTITDAAVALNQTSSTIGKVVSGVELSTIPVNGRDYGAYLNLAPGAINTGDGSLRAVRIGGRTKDDNNILMDGVDHSSIREGPGYLVALRTVISNDAIAEFKVDSQLYTAEAGYNMGAQVQFVSKSGTNELHGGVFEYFRNSALDARRFVDTAKPPFRMNQFGGNVGGPIRSNRTFFFANFEGLRQVLNQTFVGFVPSESFKQRALAQSPALAPVLRVYPTGQRPTAQADILETTYVGKQNWTENSGMFRIDHRFSDRYSGYVRYNTSSGAISSPLSLFNDRREEFMGAHNAVVQLQAILSPTTLNEFKLGFNRAAQFRPQIGAVREAVSVPGLTSTLGDGGPNDPGNTYSVIDNFSTVRGRHTLKAGFEIRKIEINFSTLATSSIGYLSLADFAANRADTIGALSNIATRGTRSWVYMGYLQDEWKIKPNLTANIGLRYEFYYPFYEVANRGRVFDQDVCRGYCPAGTKWYDADRNNIDPRVSFAWSPRALNNKATIRVGGGFYHQFGQLDDFIAPAENDTLRLQLTARETPGLSYPIDPFLTSGQPVGDTPRSLAFRNRRDMVNYQFGATINYTLPLAFELQTGYSAALGRHLMDRKHVNTIDPATGQRPLPQFGSIDRKGSDGVSNFHGLQVGLNRRFTRGWLWGTQYMWSKSIDDSSAGANESQLAQNARCRRCDRARSQFDVRQTATLSSTYELPFGKGRKYLNGGFGAVVLGGWEGSGIFTARTGRPLSVILTRSSADIPDGNTRAQQRPDAVAGVSQIPSNQTADSWINFDAFRTPARGTFGNLGRNTIDGPGLVQLDFSLAKRVPITERMSMAFRVEAFNLLNRAQYGQPQNNLSSRSNFGRVTTPLNTGATGTGTARQLQFMLRLQF